MIPPIENAIRSNGRINCNEYVENLLKNHNFTLEDKHIHCNPKKVLETVPSKYQKYFIDGYNSCSSSVRDTSLQPMQTEYIPKLKPSYEETNKEVSFQRKKIDYEERQKRNAELGAKGEELVYKEQYSILSKAVEEGLIASVDDYLEWVSLTDDSCGYDIKSYSLEDNEVIYIEVKTTESSITTPFYISSNEVEFSENHASNYQLYRVYNYKENTEVPYYIIKGNLKENDKLELISDSYIIKPK